MFQLNAVPKPQHKRNRPTAKQRGAISTKVRKELRERSGGICEKCYSHLATDAAHTIRRWQVVEHTTVQLLIHLCRTCHIYCDNTRDGRAFLEQFSQSRMEEMK